MWGEIDLADMPVLNDFGVGLQHYSQPYTEAVRQYQFCETPVATYSAPAGSVLFDERQVTSSDYQNGGPVGLSDPLARELYVADPVKQQAGSPGEITSPREALASSILHVHEPIHAGLADQFSHHYGVPRLESFVATIRLIREGPWAQPREFTNMLQPSTLVWEAIEHSKFVQEAVALGGQRRYLEQLAGTARDPGWQTLPEQVQYYDLIESYVSTGDWKLSQTNHSPDEIIQHALGDWLGYRISQQPWEIDPFDFVFRISLPNVSLRMKDGPSFTPDDTLTRVARIPADVIAEEDSHGQQALLSDYLESDIGEPVDIFVDDSGSATISDIDNVGQDEVVSDWQTQQYQRAVEYNHWWILPLFAPSYPGTQRGAETTLWELLDGMAVDTARASGELRRRVWLEQQYAWARGTPLLRITVALWQLRDRTVLPIIRAFHSTTELNIDMHLSVAKSIADDTDIKFGWFSETDGSKIAGQVRELYQDTHDLYSSVEWLFDNLETLGKAIHFEDSDVVDQFYRS